MQFRIFPTTRAPGQVRQVLSALTGVIDRASLADLRSVVTEVINVCVAHGASRPIDLSLHLADDEIECLINDHGPGTQALITAKQREDKSFVLRIINSLVEDWDASALGSTFGCA